MSLNPAAGHLYHDFNITNSYTVLDAQEKMKTREINARETKYLDKYMCSLDKAKRSFQNNNEREQKDIRKLLENIKTKTVTLDKGLKKESQRSKLFDDALNEANATNSKTYDIAWQSAKTGHRPNFVSAKSIYANLSNEQRNSVKNQTKRDQDNNSKQGYLQPKTMKLLKKADNITKSLHKLYTKNLERKWKDTSRTVVDALNSETNEELEKALYVLRGTHAGTLIEGILRERWWSGRASSESYGRRDWSLSSAHSNEQDSDPVFITEINAGDGMERITLLNNNLHSANQTNNLVTSRQLMSESGLFPDISNMVKSTATSRTRNAQKLDARLDVNKTVFSAVVLNMDKNIAENDKMDFPELFISKTRLLSSSSPAKMISDEEKEGRQLISASDVNLDFSNVFERDDPDSMASTIVNPSENEYVPTLKWRDIFKTPAVWQQNRRTVQTICIQKPKPISLVKVNGKYRQTLLK